MQQKRLKMEFRIRAHNRRDKTTYKLFAFQGENSIIDAFHEIVNTDVIFQVTFA